MATRVTPLDLVISAQDARKSGATEWAESILRDVIDRYPSCAEAYSQLGILLPDADRPGEARPMFMARRTTSWA